MKQNKTEQQAADDAAEDRLRTAFDDSMTALSSVRATLAEMLRELDDGTGNIRDLVIKQRELQTALIRAQDTEQKYHEWKSKHDDGTGKHGDTFDLDAARYQIGCRLARLRECCREG